MLSPPVTNAFVMQSVPDTSSFLSLTSGLRIIFPFHLYQQHGATFALYPSDVKTISFFKCKMFHTTWGKPAVKFLKVAILAKDQSRG